MLSAGFESTISAGDRQQTCALDCVDTGTDWHVILLTKILVILVRLKRRYFIGDIDVDVSNGQNVDC
jgi:hypothetical protein